MMNLVKTYKAEAYSEDHQRITWDDVDEIVKGVDMVVNAASSSSIKGLACDVLRAALEAADGIARLRVEKTISRGVPQDTFDKAVLETVSRALSLLRDVLLGIIPITNIGGERYIVVRAVKDFVAGKARVSAGSITIIPAEQAFRLAIAGIVEPIRANLLSVLEEPSQAQEARERAVG